MTAKRLSEDETTDRRFPSGQWRMPVLEQGLGVMKPMLGNCLMAGGLVYGVPISGEDCGSLAQASYRWRQSVLAIVAAVADAVVFFFLRKANNYQAEIR